MNPWDIVSWIGAIAVAIIILGMLYLFVRQLVKPAEHPADRALRRLERGERG
ncbi:MAG: hypothetical protein ACQEW8_10715 [Actinomycetota bacterium]